MKKEEENLTWQRGKKQEKTRESVPLKTAPSIENEHEIFRQAEKNPRENEWPKKKRIRVCLGVCVSKKKKKPKCLVNIFGANKGK